ncbi:MAG: RNA 2'-phosphotransferase [Anaerolineales bacterium]
MKQKRRTHLSKFLSLILRHKPEEIGLTLDRGGWVEIEKLLTRANRQGVNLDRATLKEIVESNPKNRFEISMDGERIRARYGHSLEVNLGYQPQEPPDVLYHGTAHRFLKDIKQNGLRSQGRKYVHLSSTAKVARQVGSRHGKPIILRLDARRMQADGCDFYSPTEEIWLVKDVPPEYLLQVK